MKPSDALPYAIIAFLSCSAGYIANAISGSLWFGLVVMTSVLVVGWHWANFLIRRKSRH